MSYWERVGNTTMSSILKWRLPFLYFKSPCRQWVWASDIDDMEGASYIILTSVHYQTIEVKIFTSLCLRYRLRVTWIPVQKCRRPVNELWSFVTLIARAMRPTVFVLFRWSSKGGYDGRVTWHLRRRREMERGFR